MKKSCFRRLVKFMPALKVQQPSPIKKRTYKLNIELNKGGNESLRVLGGVEHNALRQSQQIRSL